jgi:hypothetical protein
MQPQSQRRISGPGIVLWYGEGIVSLQGPHVFLGEKTVMEYS